MLKINISQTSTVMWYTVVNNEKYEWNNKENKKRNKFKTVFLNWFFK